MTDAPMCSPAHSYFSMVCLHREHTACRLACPLCGVPCACDCHWGGATVEEETP